MVTGVRNCKVRACREENRARDQNIGRSWFEENVGAVALLFLYIDGDGIFFAQAGFLELNRK